MKSTLKGLPIKYSSKTTPICFFPSGDLLCYNNGGFLIVSNGRITTKNKPVFRGFSDIVGSKIRIINRLLRTGPRSGIAIDEYNALISKGNYIYEYNVISNRLTKGYYCGEGIRPLSFCNVYGINGFKDGIYFGGYLMNMEKAPVSIYYRTGVDKWEIVYTFPKGTINHVHSIIADEYRNCLWIFTGDFDEASAIWKVTNDFKSIERVFFNAQKYRSCVAFAVSEGILYATDTPFTDNGVYLYDIKANSLKELFPLHGSCIYGCKWGNQYVLSSTVEGDGRDNSFIRSLFSRRRGAGIVDEYVHLYTMSIQDGIKEIYMEKKDKLPFYLFQFGAFRFPAGNNLSNVLFFQPVATTDNDLSLMTLTAE